LAQLPPRFLYQVIELELFQFVLGSAPQLICHEFFGEVRAHLRALLVSDAGFSSVSSWADVELVAGAALGFFFCIGA